MFSWWCVWVSVRRFLGFVLGDNSFLQCNDAKVLFCICCCFASNSRLCDVIDAKDEVHGVMYHLPLQINMYFNFYRFLFLFGYNLYLHLCFFLAQKHLYKNIMYILNRLEKIFGKSMIAFHAIWGLCWNFFASKRLTSGLLEKWCCFLDVTWL